ncbi:hypothetical protein FQR65_LT14318 [Abscondita terminalis]|nr:hypothetical protein FQR65_LT14318 [Abscondita terminalis]
MLFIVAELRLRLCKLYNVGCKPSFTQLDPKMGLKFLKHTYNEIWVVVTELNSIFAFSLLIEISSNAIFTIFGCFWAINGTYNGRATNYYRYAGDSMWIPFTVIHVVVIVYFCTAFLDEEALTSSECLPVGPHQPSTSSVDEHVVADKHKEEVVKTKDIGVLVKPSFRSRYVMCNIQTEKCDTASSPGTFLKPTDVATSPIKSTLITAKKSLSIKKKLFSHPSTSSGNDEFESTSSYIPNSDTDFAESEFESVEENFESHSKFNSKET